MDRVFFPAAKGPRSSTIVSASKIFLYHPPPNVSVAVSFADGSEETVGPFENTTSADAYIAGLMSVPTNEVNMGKVVSNVQFIQFDHPPPNHAAIVRFVDGSKETVGPADDLHEVQRLLKRRNFVVWGAPTRR